MSDKIMIRHEVVVVPRYLIGAMIGIAVLLLCCHAALTVYHYRIEELPWLLRQIFDVDEEDTLPTWFSAILLLSASMLSWLSVRMHGASGDGWLWHWRLIAVGFLLMSVDEVAGVHETLNSVLDVHWTSWGVPIVAVAALAYVPFLRHLPVRTALGFVLGGSVFVGGAAGIEVLGIPLDADTLKYNLLTLAEEGFEMGGVIIYINALLGYLARLNE